jgi:N-acetylneuraminate synthase
MKDGTNNSRHMKKTIIVAEIGINYAYGNDKSNFLDNTKKLIDAAYLAGCNWVKFQKRNPDICVPEQQKNKPKRVPWREEETTYIQYKHDIEFGKEEYDEIDRYCLEKGIGWFASVWDKWSVEFIEQNYTNGGCVIMKIPSALINDIDLCSYARDKSDFLIVSTGMSTEEEVFKCVNYCDPDVVMHTNSSYPSKVDELNLEYITWLKETYPAKIIGYSGHEFGLVTTMAATLLGATWIERHITLDRTNWGSDQMASVEPGGLIKLVKGIRDIEKSMGGYGPRLVLGSELEKLKSLRR